MSNQFNPGDKVRYVPTHAEGDVYHRDCEPGVVTTVREDSNGLVVFVWYGSRSHTSARTSVTDLVICDVEGFPLEEVHQVVKEEG